MISLTLEGMQNNIPDCLSSARKMKTTTTTRKEKTLVAGAAAVVLDDDDDKRARINHSLTRKFNDALDVYLTRFRT